MKILLYAPYEDTISEELWSIVLEIVPKNNAEKYISILDLADRLNQQRTDIQLVLLSASTKQELKNLVFLKDLLLDIRIILIIPDRDQDTISMAHTLYPRFLTYIDSNFCDVKAVLAKMVEKMHTN